MDSALLTTAPRDQGQENEMSTFAERKAERKAAQQSGIKYNFAVVEQQYTGKTVAVFSSKKEADRFANEQIGCVAGNTRAYQAWCALLRENTFAPNARFSVVRIEA